jgi:hypothetical protein
VEDLTTVMGPQLRWQSTGFADQLSGVRVPVVPPGISRFVPSGVIRVG